MENVSKKLLFLGLLLGVVGLTYYLSVKKFNTSSIREENLSNTELWSRIQKNLNEEKCEEALLDTAAFIKKDEHFIPVLEAQRKCAARVGNLELHGSTLELLLKIDPNQLVYWKELYQVRKKQGDLERASAVRKRIRTMRSPEKTR